jgi:mannose-1-phosphate guanylyltransferase
VSLPAVILVGGLGTRLRPLTDRTRKDMLPLVDRPQLAYTFEHLRRFGVTRAIISCGYLPTQIQEYFGDRYGDLRLEYKIEQEPLGTGGAIRFAAEGIDEPFFALNGDSLRETDLGALVDFHRERKCRATILLTPVEDPSRYGLVRVHSDDGRVLSFLEKPRPEEIDTNLINAGMYVLEPDVLELIPSGRPVSIEREVFPQLVEEQGVYGVALAGYWLDIGTPDAYLQAHRDVLERNFVTELGDGLGSHYTLVTEGAEVSPNARLVPPVFVGEGARIAAGARIGSLAVIGANTVIGEGASIESSVIGAGAKVGPRTHVSGSIVGEQAELGVDCEVRGLSVVGPGARVGDRNMLDHGVRIAAGESIAAEALQFS